MIRLGLIVALSMILIARDAIAETVIAARTLRANTIIGPSDLIVQPGDVPGALTDTAGLVGMETRVALYAGRPVRDGDIGPPAIIERNQIVTLVYDNAGLRIATEGRALARGGVGDAMRIMNLGSRSTVTALVHPNGTLHVFH